MSEAIELSCVLAHKDGAMLGREQVVRKTTAVLTAHGVGWEAEADNLFLYEDGSCSEHASLSGFAEPIRTAADEHDGLASLLDWPAMGFLDGYSAAGFGFSLGFAAHPGKAVRNVTLRVLASRAFRKSDDALRWFTSVGHSLHRELHAGRTFMTWGLGLKTDFTLDEEHARLCAGEIVPFGFEFLDIIRVG